MESPIHHFPHSPTPSLPYSLISLPHHPFTKMQRTIINTPAAPAPVGPYNQAVAVSGQMLFVSGQIALDPATGQLVGEGDVVAQTEQVIGNLEAILTAAGASFDNVVKTSVFLKDMGDFGAMNEIYAKYFGGDNAPARACVEVARLPKDVAVEIECIAVL
ncbi:RidA family protein [Nodosilinea sp. FACHB-141]|nr:RidA family protein [Nodosilinea sp. FACHB-141]